MSKRLEGKLALITGATHGIGAAVAEEFAKQGADLILVGRDTQALEKIDDIVQSHGVHATLVPLDLKNFQSIDEMVYAVAQRYQKLDILVGNAGILGHLGPITDGTPADWHDVMDVNLNANWRLLKACDPMLKQAPAGRAIFVTSGVASRVMAYWNAYAVSKVALEAMVRTYAKEVETTYPNLRVNLLNPGAVRTGLRAKAMPGEDPSTLPAPVDIVKAFVDLASDECRHHGDVIQAQG
jgi:NAD(P)-dependent dehydrogenase (short-subunit alcohol dehydrogenase family)